MIKQIAYTALAAASLLMPVVALAAANPDSFATVSPFSGTSSGTIIDAVRNIVNALLGLAAIVAVIFVIIGGVRYITAQGDEDAVAAAKNTVIYALIGVVVIALSAVIVNFIIASI